MGCNIKELVNNSTRLNGISNRASFTYKNDILNLSQKEVSFRLMRSIVDRGIRLLVIEANNVDDIIYCDNTYNYLNNELDNKGYYINKV